jgi:dihydrofolate reductase
MRNLMANWFVPFEGFAAARALETRWVTDHFGPQTARFVRDTCHGIDVMLLGGATYEALAPYWSSASVDDEPLAGRMNSTPKLVFSTTLEEPLTWSNSKLARGGLIDQVIGLKQQPGGELGVVGSVRLTRSLAGAGLLDGYRLLVDAVAHGGDGHSPVFEEFDRNGLRLVSSRILDSRVVALEYRLAAREDAEESGALLAGA